jgi:hypothetical protein
MESSQQKGRVTAKRRHGWETKTWQLISELPGPDSSHSTEIIKPLQDIIAASDVLLKGAWRDRKRRAPPSGRNCTQAPMRTTSA